jgi:hypothetical protein
VTNINEVLKARGMGPDMTIEETLNERGKRYGDFDTHAIITQCLKDVMHEKIDDCPTNWVDLSPDKKEALEMIAHKIGRILNGDPNYKDSWVDIAGYAQLVANTLNDDATNS